MQSKFSHILKLYGLIIAFLLIITKVSGQDIPKIDVKLSRDTILIGDQINLTLTVEKDITQIIVLPEINSEATNGIIETIGEPVIDTLELDGRKIVFQVEHKITSFESGIYTFKPFPMLYVDKNITDTLYSDSLKLTVDTYFIDTATYVMEDITNIIKEPFTFDELKFYIKDALKSPYTYIGLLIVILSVIGWYFYKRYKNKNKYVRPVEPPHIVAIKELEVIANAKLWENRRYKEYYTRITDVIRTYIHQRYGVNAMELTSHEIFDAFSNTELSNKDMERLKELLLLSDFVKFAKAIPSEDECRESYNDAYYFVEDTKLMPLQNEGAEEVSKN